MNYKSFNLGDWIGHISGVIEDETTLDGNEMRDLVEFLSTLEREPCEDAISRETVLKMQYRIDDSATLATRDVVNVEDIEELPSIQPKVKTMRDLVEFLSTLEQEPKTGHWIKQDLGYKCSNCTLCTNEKGRLTYNYCPNCGAKMED